MKFYILRLIIKFFKIVNNRINPLLLFGFVLCIFISENSFGQQSEKGFDFESIYSKGIEALIPNPDVSKQCLKKLEDHKKELSLIQQAQTNYLRLKVIYAETNAVKALEKRMFAAPDTLDHADALIYSARKFLEKSMPDKAIHLLMEALDTINAGSEKADYCRINLCEAYRQKQEYNKGIGMLYSILANGSISIKNRAFALNRMAALMNEKKPFDGNRADSVEKYSRLSIEISEKHNLTEYLALSQNELGNNYLRQKKTDSALILITEAANNFLSIKKYPQVINTYLNLSRLYSQTGQLEESRKILHKALELGNIEENRNLFKYAYYYLAEISFKTNNYASAYEYLKISYSLMTRFFDDRIQQQINEMSAKYDLQEKETKIKEEAQKSKTYRLQLKYIVIISLITTILLVVLVVLSRFKNQAYKKLVEQNLKAMKLEKQVEMCLRNLSEHDIMNRVVPLDQNAELALRLEKFMADEKPYLWGDVGLEEFCKKLSTNRTYLSKLINEKYQMSFYDLLFVYRVRTAMECLTNPEFKHLSVEGIGEMAGFKSNSNFYKRFKNTVGMTPHQFREKAQELEKHLPA